MIDPARQSISHVRLSRTWKVRLLAIGGLMTGLIGLGLFLAAGQDVPDPAPVLSKFHTPERRQHAERAAATDEIREAEAGADETVSPEDLLVQPSPEEEISRLKQQLADLQRQLERIQVSTVSVDVAQAVPGEQMTGPTPSPSNESVSDQPPPSPTGQRPPSGPFTLRYWNELNAIIDQEAALRAVPASGISSANAASFFEARIRAARYAVDAIGALETEGVDPRAESLAGMLVEWYENGRTVAETGRDLLTRGSTARRKGAAGEQYREAEQSHARAVDRINAEGKRLQADFSKDYRLEFPPLR